MKEYVVGVDIGSSKVCAIAGKLDKYGKMQVMGVTSTKCSGIKRGIVVDIDSTAECIKDCIEQMERMIDFDISDIFISIPGEICELIVNRGVVAVSSEDREIKKNDVDRVLKAAKIITISSDKEIIGVIPQQFMVDGYDNITDPIGMSGLRLEVDAQLILSQSTVINNLFKSIKKAGLNLSGMVFQPLGTANVVLKAEEMKIGTLLLDIGAENTNISVFKNGKLCYSDNLALGGNIITNDISLCLRIPFSEAEKLKVNYGSGKSNFIDEDFKIKINTNYDNIVEIDYNVLTEIITARVEEILLLIKKKLMISEQMDNVSGVVVVGGGIALLKGCSDLCKEILDKPVRIGIPDYTGVDSPICAAAVGVVKDVVDSGKVNLCKEEALDEMRSHKSKKYEKKSIVWDDEKDEEDTEESSNGVFSKIRNFFADFF
ncbi:cell division protein FtsA [Clostridium pascui]|uniref:cell division protein FtsA n=1 Tax=Clostridium pascui TaxID=46609 RepID=UPI00195B297D|nr:cell division protein FtsA [Clostridium pascui]MBM7868843.1 cell division protein FtsA [Clostridium pascui]